MSVLLVLVLLVAVEIGALVAVADQIGVLAAVVLLLVVSACGPWLVRRAGFGAWRRAQARMLEGAPLEQDALDGLLLLTAGLLICIPGFVTDAAGILLLLPPVRAVLRRRITRRLAQSVVTRFGGPGRGAGGFGGLGGAGGRGRWTGGPWDGGAVLDADSRPARGPGDTPPAGDLPRPDPDGGAPGPQR